MHKALLAKGKMTARYFQIFSSGLETSSAFDLNIWCFFYRETLYLSIPIIYAMLNVHSIETFATQDGPGIRLVVFLQGCMFRCQYCHNPDTIPLENENAKHRTADDILLQAVKQREYFREKGGITFSGGEPLTQAAALLPVVQKLKAEGFHICIDTNGFWQTPEAKEVLSLADLILPDLKHINPEKHLKLVGQSNENTLKTLDYLDEIKKPYWLRYVLVPGYTDDEEDLHTLGKYLQTRTAMERIEILPYHNLGKSKWDKLGWKYPLEGVHAATSQNLDTAKRILSQYSEKVFVRG